VFSWFQNVNVQLQIQLLYRYITDWEEGGYRGSDAGDPAIGMPRGEVLIGGPVVCQGYYTSPNMPDADLEAGAEQSSTLQASTPAVLSPAATDRTEAITEMPQLEASSQAL
jgi:hypothetical protein